MKLLEEYEEQGRRGKNENNIGGKKTFKRQRKMKQSQKNRNLQDKHGGVTYCLFVDLLKMYVQNKRTRTTIYLIMYMYRCYLLGVVNHTLTCQVTGLE